MHYYGTYILVLWTINFSFVSSRPLASIFFLLLVVTHNNGVCLHQKLSLSYDDRRIVGTGAQALYMCGSRMLLLLLLLLLLRMLMFVLII